MYRLSQMLRAAIPVLFLVVVDLRVNYAHVVSIDRRVEAGAVGVVLLESLVASVEVACVNG